MTSILAWLTALAIVTMLCNGCGLDESGLLGDDTPPPTASIHGLWCMAVSPECWQQSWYARVALAGETDVQGVAVVSLDSACHELPSDGERTVATVTATVTGRNVAMRFDWHTRGATWDAQLRSNNDDTQLAGMVTTLGSACQLTLARFVP